jgi:O-antigen ligase
VGITVNATKTLGAVHAPRERNIAIRSRYPLLYWATFVYIVGVPNFVHFDSTGRTRNPLNLTSISSVIITAVVSYLLIAILLLSRQPLVVRSLRIHHRIWITLIVELVIVTALGPRGHSMPVTAASRLLAFFRLGQWIIAFSLIVALVSRTSSECVPSLTTRLIGRISWVWIALVWILLPILPSQVYGSSDEDSHVARRLGGQLINPAHVALLASMAFFYALLFFPRGPRKWIALLIALMTIGLTGARAQQAGFVVVFLLYAVLLSRKPALRWATIGIVCFAIWMAIPFSSSLAKYVARGQSIQTLSTLDDRTRVWQASILAIQHHPLFGYGYSVGARSAIRDNWQFAHWIPPHAHNEFLEATLDGGVLALLMILALYGLVLWKGLRNIRSGPTSLFLFLIFSQFAMDAITGGTLGYVYRETGGIFLLCAVGILSTEKRVTPSHILTRRRAYAMSQRGATLVVQHGSFDHGGHSAGL